MSSVLVCYLYTNRMTGRDTLTGAVWKCIAFLSDSHSKNQRDTVCILARTLQVFESFLSELELIDREAQEKRGQYYTPLLTLIPTDLLLWCIYRGEGWRVGAIGW